MDTKENPSSTDCRWAEVAGYEGLYRISTSGHLFSVRKNRIMSPSNADNGYSRVNLSRYINADRSVKIAYIHRLVAFAFIPNPENHPWVNHKNGIKADNRLENLEWDTIQNNHIHAYRTGLHVSVKGSQVGAAKLTEAQALEIFNSRGSARITAQKYGISKGTVSLIRRKGSWTHIHAPA